MQRNAENSDRTETTRSTVFRTAVVVIVVSVALAGLTWSAWEIIEPGNDNPVTPVQKVELVRPSDVQTPSAEDRATNVLTKIIVQQQTDMPKPRAVVSEVKIEAPPRPSSPPQALPTMTVKLNCARLGRAYSETELATMKEYQQLCK